VFGAAYDTIYILYLVRTHDFSAGMIGLIFSIGSIGVLGGSFISSWITSRIGVGRTLLFGFLFMAIGGFIVPAAEGSRYFVYALILVAEVTFVLGIVIWNIGQVSLRQAVTPGSLLGRVNSILIVMGRASVPVGALIGGYLGELMGLRGAIYVFAAGISVGAIWLVVLGFWNLKGIPEVDDQYDAEVAVAPTD
jgi:MFS family permease